MFRKEDRIALPVAIALHVAVVAVLLLQPVREEVMEIPRSMNVSLATEVSLEATAPEPVLESSAAIAPVLGEELAPDTTETPPEATPDTPTPPPVNVTRRNTTTPTPPARDRSRPDRTRPKPSPSPARAAERGGGSRIGDDFLPGQGSSTTTTETRIPASQVGASAKASIRQAINRQLRPHWKGKAPSGADADQLVTIVAFELNEDGSLKGRPRVVRQTGVTPSNQNQKGRHAEIAVRAVQLAAPFDLPDEYYNAWKSITAWQFDRRL